MEGNEHRRLGCVKGRVIFRAGSLVSSALPFCILDHLQRARASREVAGCV